MHRLMGCSGRTYAGGLGYLVEAFIGCISLFGI